MNPLANAGVSGAAVSLVVAYMAHRGVPLSADIVAALVTLTYAGAHYLGAFVNGLLARYVPGVEAAVQAIEPMVVQASEPVVVRAAVSVAEAPKPVGG